MSHLEENLSALGRRFPELAHFLGSIEEAPRLAVLSARSGAPSARLGGASIHSRYDPEAEAARFVSSLPDDCAACLFFGFGLGYLPQSFLSARPDSLAIVVEPDPCVLKAALGSRDLRDLLLDERISLLIGARPESIVQALDDLHVDEPARLPLKAYLDAYPDYFSACDRALARHAAKERINDNTLRRFGTLWVRNLSRNLPWMGKVPGIKGLFGSFQGFPALVVAAGPSLDDVLPRLPELARKYLIIAVDTAAVAVQRAGVHPDFCVVVDPQYWNTRHLDGFDPRFSVAITESAVHPAVLRREWKAVFLCSSIFPLGRYIEERLGEMGTLGAGGSVATSAWDFARLLGCSPILMAGLDLGFPGHATHSRDSYFERRALTRGFRFMPVESDSFLAFRAADPYRAPDNSGGSVFTDRRMALYAWWFEARLSRADASSTYSLSEKGLSIPGLPYRPLSDFPAADDCRIDLDPILDRIAQRKANPAMEFAQAFEALVQNLSALESQARRALALCDRALGKIKRGEGAAREIRDLSEIDSRMLGNPAKEIVSFLFPDIRSIVFDKPGSLSGALENSARIYREACKQAEYHVRALKREG